ERPELFEEYLGGTGVATHLLSEHAPRGVDPLAPEAPIVFAIGPLESLFPCVTKTVATFKSPATGNYGESHAGGRLGMAMRMADLGAIVITGRAKYPSYLVVSDDAVKVRDASTLSGLSTFATGRVLREVEKGVGKRSIVRIGPAGENGVRFANVNVDTYRHFGRLGLGAVFGSKNLKGMVVSGRKELDIPDLRRYQEMYHVVYELIVNIPFMKKYHDLGTTANILPLNEMRALPTRNLRETSFEHAHDVSGERFAKDFLGRNAACSHCPVGCIHIANLRVPYGSGYEYETLQVSYDYELIYALGTMLGMTSPEDVLKLIEKVERTGLDAITTGCVLSWATEAYGKGLITSQHTNGVSLRWGKVDDYLKAIKYISSRENEFYKDAGMGAGFLGQKYGGKDFAIALAGNEIAGYHTGYANILGHAYGARNSHLSNGGYALDQSSAMKPLKAEDMVSKLISDEQSRSMFNSLVACLFARSVFSEELISEMLGSVGLEYSEDELKQIGKKVYREKMAYKLAEGFDPSAVEVPGRFFETITPVGRLDPAKMDEMKAIYAERIRGIIAGGA
ncbi:MAG: hypothetical protein LUO79_03570, partial [Methanomassiliicoccales archaeon]|nr:hypothetical protein [Methanomassiliicoccales archaeon]